MAARSSSVTVDTTPAKVITGGDADGTPFSRSAIIKNTGSTTAYFGGPDVDADNGFPVAAGEGIEMSNVALGDLPYAVTDSGSTTLSILETGV